jgi:hypothetical protein
MRLHYLDWGNRDQPKMLLLHGGAQTHRRELKHLNHNKQDQRGETCGMVSSLITHHIAGGSHADPNP